MLATGVGLLFAYAFAFQIYCDFAAYSTIARGIVRLFGVDLMRNFLTPYFSAGPSEFWTRWHISLSTWLRDYLYIPLGGNRGGALLTMRNLMLTMFLGGLWHGAGVLFIVWGLYHGILLVLYRLPIDTLLAAKLGRFGKLLSIFIFFHLVCIGWVFFRATPEQLIPITTSMLALPEAIRDAIAKFAPNWHDVYLGHGNFFRTLKSTIWGMITQNWIFSVYAWGALVFAVPVIAADHLGWRRGIEFPDLLKGCPGWSACR